MRLSFTKKIWFSFLFILIVLIAAVVYYFSLSRRLNETERLINRTDTMLLCSQNIFNATIDLENGCRGYVIMGNEIFLEPFIKAVPLKKKNIIEIKRLADSSQQQPGTLKLEQLLIQRESFARKVIDLRKSKGFEQAQQLIATGQGRRITDSIRNTIYDINHEQRQLLQDAKSESKTDIRYFESLVVVLFCFVAITLFLIGLVIYRYEKERRRNEAALLNYQNELEKKVNERTTELAKSFEGLKKQEELLEATSALAKVGGWEIELGDMMVNWTNEVYNIHELQRGKMPTVEEALTYYAPEARPIIAQAVNDAIAQGTGWDLELPFITAKGNHLWVRSIGKAETSNDIPRVFGVFQDITSRKIAEEKLKTQYSKLVIANSELEQFAYVASHDLQEPLRTVTSFLTLLERKYENIIDDKGKRYIDFAVDGSKRMRQIIQDLLEFSKVGRTEGVMVDLDLNELINEIQILFAEQINEKKAAIHTNRLPVINSYKAPLRQVFQNLIGNALKYSRKDIPVKILISAIPLKDHWQFCVADNGIGIDSEYFDKIFIIFQRLHNKDEFSGTGIGLPVTKKIIENFGGKIWVESEEGKGSSFYFTIAKSNNKT